MANITHSHIHNDSQSTGNAIEQNCRENWPLWTCYVANIAGLCSATMWFLVLFPQLWKNFRRRSVKGLSLLWATANFTAAFINIFFVFMYAKIPLYGQIVAVYCPILEFVLLLQFLAYSHHSRTKKALYVTACMVIWGVIVALEVWLRIGSALEYVAILLWSAETFPQIVLNMRLHSTSGQATLSAFIASVGKTTDFVATNGLVMPLQYVIMRYFSSSVAYINYLQIAWYLGNGKNMLSGVCCKPNVHQSNGDNSDADKDEEQRLQLDIANGGVNRSLEMQPTEPAATSIEPEVKQSPLMFLVRCLCLFILICFLVICVIGFVWNIESYYGLFAPVGIICVLGTAKVYLIMCYRGAYVNQNTQ